MSTRQSRRQIGGWTRVLAARVEEERFASDMTRLRELGAAFVGAPAWQQDTIWTQLRNDMSLEARKAVFGAWPTFEQMWLAAGGAA